jgi:hypothetical protein
MVVCGKSISACQQSLKGRALPKDFFLEPPANIATEKALSFVWRFADDRNRSILERLANRQLYKRVFEVKLGDLGGHIDYSTLKNDLMPQNRVVLADKLEDRMIDSIHKSMAERGPRESVSENEAKKRHEEISMKSVPRIVIDFPVRGIPDEKNFPGEIGDPARKYLSGPVNQSIPRRNVFYTVRTLQSEIASLRIFAAEELHELNHPRL